MASRQEILADLVRGGSLGALRQALEQRGDPAELVPALHAAASRGAVDSVQLLLRHDAPTGGRDSHGRTALHHAVGELRLPAVRLLLESGSDVNARDNEGRTPLHGIKRSQGWKAIAAALAERGADFDALDGAGRPPTWNCAHLEGMALHRRPPTFWVFHEHVAAGDAEAVVRSLDGGARVDVRDGEGQTPLHVAASRGLGELVTVLLDRGADPLLFDHAGWAAIHHAASQGRRQIAAALLDRGVPVDHPDGRGWRPLHHATISDHTAVMELLLAAGADAEVGGPEGTTALHLAARAGLPAAIELLLLHGAHPSTRQQHGDTALHQLALGVHRIGLCSPAQPRALAALDLLLAHSDTDVDAKRDGDGRTALHLLLADESADPRRAASADSRGADAAPATPMVRRGLFGSLPSVGGSSWLWRGGYESSVLVLRDLVVERLLRSGADPEVADADGRSPLALALRTGRPELLRSFADRTPVEGLPTDHPLLRPRPALHRHRGVAGVAETELARAQMVVAPVKGKVWLCSVDPKEGLHPVVRIELPSWRRAVVSFVDDATLLVAGRREGGQAVLVRRVPIAAPERSSELAELVLPPGHECTALASRGGVVFAGGRPGIHGLGLFDCRTERPEWTPLRLPDAAMNLPDKPVEDIVMRDERLVVVDNLVLPKWLLVYDVSLPARPWPLGCHSIQPHTTYEQIHEASLGSSWLSLLSSGTNYGDSSTHLALLDTRCWLEVAVSSWDRGAGAPTSHAMAGDRVVVATASGVLRSAVMPAPLPLEDLATGCATGRMPMEHALQFVPHDLGLPGPVVGLIEAAGGVVAVVRTAGGQEDSHLISAQVLRESAGVPEPPSTRSPRRGR